METATYTPNISHTPLGLLQFECTWPTVTALTAAADELSFDIHQYNGQDADNQQQVNILADVAGIDSDGACGASIDLGCCWSSEPDMILGGGVGAAGLDLESLPALFPFSPSGCQQGLGQQSATGNQDDSGGMPQDERGVGSTEVIYKTESSPVTSPNTSDPLSHPSTRYQQHTHHHFSSNQHSSPTTNNDQSTCPLHTQLRYNTTIDNLNHNNNNEDEVYPHHKVGEGTADVLLSLKHAVVHPVEPQSVGGGYYGGVGGATAGLYGTGDGMIEGNSNFQNGQHHYHRHHHHHHHQGSPLFSSMSVNVSMNMTMHGYHPDGNYCPATTEINYPQVQWSATPHQCSHHHHHQTILSPPPPYATGATYSITADFRPTPSTVDNQQQLSTTNNNMFPFVGPSITSPMVPGAVNVNGASRDHHQMMMMDGMLGGAAPYKVAGERLSRRGSTMSVGSGDGCYSEGEECGTTTGRLTEIGTGQKSNVCRICGKSYARPSTLKTHLRTHSGEKPYRCTDCSKSFSQAANLTAHVRTHSGEKPFRCPVCDRRFSQSSSVTTHMRTHNGERPYRCRLCRKAFSDSSTLTKHLRIHSGEKPYECKLCLLRFSQSGNLNRHMRVHNSGVQCLLGVI